MLSRARAAEVEIKHLLSMHDDQGDQLVEDTKKGKKKLKLRRNSDQRLHTRSRSHSGFLVEPSPSFGSTVATESPRDTGSGTQSNPASPRRKHSKSISTNEINAVLAANVLPPISHLHADVQRMRKQMESICTNMETLYKLNHTSFNRLEHQISDISDRDNVETCEGKKPGGLFSCFGCMCDD